MCAMRPLVRCSSKAASTAAAAAHGGTPASLQPAACYPHHLTGQLYDASPHLWSICSQAALPPNPTHPRSPARKCPRLTSLSFDGPPANPQTHLTPLPNGRAGGTRPRHLPSMLHMLLTYPLFCSALTFSAPSHPLLRSCLAAVRCTHVCCRAATTTSHCPPLPHRRLPTCSHAARGRTSHPQTRPLCPTVPATQVTLSSTHAPLPTCSRTVTQRLAPPSCPRERKYLAKELPKALCLPSRLLTLVPPALVQR